MAGLRGRGLCRANAKNQRTAHRLKLVNPATQMRRRDGVIRQIDQFGMQRLFLRGGGQNGATAAHDLDAQSARTTVQLFHADKDAHGLRFQQNAVSHALSHSLKQVETLIRQLKRNRFGHLVIAQDTVHIIVDRAGQRADLNHDVETDTLGHAALRLKGTDLDLDGVIAHRNAVERGRGCGCLGPLGRVRECETDFGRHDAGPFLVLIVSLF
mmetsp:Transcript_29254/g.56725  ORF Transcript_29254/g.56725 Transcript_29254/m.56725 type:complete len:212 (-) Transcript_29254:3464-4099(-)